jgi:Mrp family chromosome partitioning ATPase
MLRLFDAVVVDTEALQLASDAVVLQRKVDGYVMVAGRHRSTTRGLRELTSRVERPRILGVVFNEH